MTVIRSNRQVMSLQGLYRRLKLAWTVRSGVAGDRQGGVVQETKTAASFVERVYACIRSVHRTPRSEGERLAERLGELIAVLSEAGGILLTEDDLNALTGMMVIDVEATPLLRKTIRAIRRARALGLRAYALRWNATGLDHHPGRTPSVGTWHLDVL